MLAAQPVDFDALWPDLEQAVRDSVQSGARCSSERWMQLYSGVYKACSHPTSPRHEQLYDRLRALFAGLSLDARAAVQEARGAPLEAYCAAFARYAAGTAATAGVFAYLDRYWVREHSAGGSTPLPEVFPVAELALHVWRREAYEPLQHALCGALLAAVEAAREADAPAVAGAATLAAFVRSCERLGLEKRRPLSLYRERIEAPFVNASEAYWRTRGFAAAAEASDAAVVAYMRDVERWTAADRADFLHESSAARVAAAVETALLDPHADRLVALARSLLGRGDGDSPDLRLLHALLARCSSGEPLAALQRELRSHVTAEGRAIVAAAADAPEPPLDALLAVHDRYRALVRDAFGGHVSFASALDKAFGTFVNELPDIPRKLAEQVHDALLSPDRQQTLLGRLTIFRFLDDKDIFREAYTVLLAQRLLRLPLPPPPAAVEAEERVLAELRRLCGWEYTLKMQRMLADVEGAAALGERFGRPAELSVLAMTAGQWPVAAPAAPVALPAPARALFAAFEAFHADAFPRRKLTWVHHLCRCDVRAAGFAQGREYTLAGANAYQAAALLALRAAPTLGALAAALEVPPPALARQLMPLLRLGIVAPVAEPPAGTINNATALAANAAFSSKLRRLPLPAPELAGPGGVAGSPVGGPTTTTVTGGGGGGGGVAGRAAADEPPPPPGPAVSETVAEDRRLLAQAGIVRCMKRLRTCAQAALEEAVREELRPVFRAAPELLHDNIERLIEREFIRRAGEELSYVP